VRRKEKRAQSGDRWILSTSPLLPRKPIAGHKGCGDDANSVNIPTVSTICLYRLQHLHGAASDVIGSPCISRYELYLEFVVPGPSDCSCVCLAHALLVHESTTSYIVMNSPPDQANGSRPETDPSSSYHEHYHGLQTGSYTDQQLVCLCILGVELQS
jgi:hypothetical protein